MSRSHRRGVHPGQLDLFAAATPERSGSIGAADPPADRTVRGPLPQTEPAAKREPASKEEPLATKPSSEDLLPRLAALMTLPISSLTLTRNRTRIVSARPRRPGKPELDVRIHRCFALADDRVVQAVAELLDASSEASRKRSLRVIREHFRLHGQDDTPRPQNLRPLGEHFDLEKLRDRVNREYFSNRVEVEITWGREARGRRKRRKGSFSIRLGSYDERLRLVRIHPVLDRREVPEYVVESIVYHEMLHAVVPPRPGAERRSVHPPEFRRLEKLYRHHDEAEAWISAHVERLAKLR